MKRLPIAKEVEDGFEACGMSCGFDATTINRLTIVLQRDWDMEVLDSWARLPTPEVLGRKFVCEDHGPACFLEMTEDAAVVFDARGIDMPTVRAAGAQFAWPSLTIAEQGRIGVRP